MNSIDRRGILQGGGAGLAAAGAVAATGGVVLSAGQAYAQADPDTSNNSDTETTLVGLATSGALTMGSRAAAIAVPFG